MMKINYDLIPYSKERKKVHHDFGLDCFPIRSFIPQVEIKSNLENKENPNEEIQCNNENFRYVIFFNFKDWDIAFVQKIGANDDISSIAVPYGTECFCFLRTDMPINEVREKFKKKKYHYEFGLPIERSTLYTIVETSNQKDKYIMDTNILGLTKEINNIRTENIYDYNLKRPGDTKKRFYYLRGITVKERCQILLLYDGSIKATSCNYDGGVEFYLGSNYSMVLSMIDDASHDYPKIYEEIINHIPADEENDCYRSLREYCLKVINDNYKKAEATLKRVKKLQI